MPVITDRNQTLDVLARLEEAKVVTANTIELVCEEANLIGTVINKSNNKPVAMAKISLDTGQNTFTDAAGSYKFGNVSVGEHLITGYKEGCNCACTLITVVEGEVTTVNTLELMCTDQ